MIVKITIFFAVILLVWYIGIRVWFSEHPKEAVEAHVSKKWPRWYIAWIYCLLIEIVLVIVSIFWILFIVLV